MGGFGSGRPWGKRSTFDYAQLDVRRLQRQGVLVPGRSSTLRWNEENGEGASINVYAEAGRLLLSWTHFESAAPDWKNGKYAIPIVRTPCNYGGARPWFLCPARRCG